MKRKAWLILLLLGGGGSLLYGSLFHTVMVDEEREREVSIVVPAMPGPGDAPNDKAEPPQGKPGSDNADPFRTPSDDGTPAGSTDNPFESPSALPGVQIEKRIEKFIKACEESEGVIIEEATVGGVERLPNGHLKRTYSGKAPARCPT
jgi:hypothetical protein